MLMAGAIAAAEVLVQAVKDTAAPWTSRVVAARIIAQSLLQTVELADHETAIRALEESAFGDERNDE
jgi:hypothetical protein